MANDNDDQEKTEEPTGKKLEKAKEEGNVSKSAEVNSVILLTLAVIVMYASAEWMWTTPDFDDGSVILMPNVRHVWSEPLSINRLTLDHTMMTVWDDGFKFAGNSSKGVFARWYGGLHWRLTENVSIRLPGWTVLAPITDPGDGRKFATSINTGITFSF